MDLNLKNSKLSVQKIEFHGPQGAIFEIVLLLIIGVLFYFFLLAPKMAEVAQKQSQLAQIQSQKDSIDKDAKALNDLNAQLASNADDFALLDQALPLEERQVRTQKLFEEIVKSSGTLIGDITVSTPAESILAGNVQLLKDPYASQRSLKTLNVGISVSGTMSQLLDLIKKLENYGRIMDISSVDFSSSKSDVLDLKLSLFTYYFGTN